MAFSTWFSLCLMLAATNQDCHATCTDEETQLLFMCIGPHHVPQFLQATLSHQDPETCDSQIVLGLCDAFAQVVNCVNSANISNDECRPTMKDEVNSLIDFFLPDFPCKVDNFQATCTSSPKLNTGTINANITTMASITATSNTITTTARSNTSATLITSTVSNRNDGDHLRPYLQFVLISITTTLLL